MWCIENLTDRYISQLEKNKALEALLAKFMLCKTESELHELQTQASEFLTVKQVNVIQYG